MLDFTLERDDAKDGSPRSRKLLLVDDYKELLEIATIMLAEAGFDVVAADSAGDALEILKNENDFHFVFTDIVMPEMNGVELGKRVQQLYPSVKVILVSDYAELAKTDIKDFESFPFMAKPFRLADIIRYFNTL